MTSTPVKDVGSVLNGLSAAGGGARTPAGAGFQKVFDGQAGKETYEKTPDSSKTAVRKAPGESLKAKDEHLARMERQEPRDGIQNGPDETDEIPAEKLEEIMETLGTAAADMIQQIADVFGVSVEEIQDAMQELGMESLDVLDQGKLGELLLKIGGAEDTYTLVTDGELYGKYQELMTQLEDVIRETGEELEMPPKQLEDVLQQLRIPEPEAKVLSAETVTETAEVLQTPEEQPEESAEPVEAGRPTVEITGTQETEKEPQTGSESRQENGGTDRRESHHILAQEIRTDQFQGRFTPEIQQTESQPVFRTDTQDIMRQIMDYMRIQVKPDVSDLEMQLHPESLGSLHIHIASKGGAVTANFIAQNDAVKAALESQMVQLRENFEQQGVKVEAIEITVQTHAFERNLDQGRGRNSGQEEPARKVRTRKIDLNTLQDAEELEEEDALAAEMMAANGNQVDYTA